MPTLRTQSVDRALVGKLAFEVEETHHHVYRLWNEPRQPVRGQEHGWPGWHGSEALGTGVGPRRGRMWAPTACTAWKSTTYITPGRSRAAP
jgi:hypothetical protein